MAMFLHTFSTLEHKSMHPQLPVSASLSRYYELLLVTCPSPSNSPECSNPEAARRRMVGAETFDSDSALMMTNGEMNASNRRERRVTDAQNGTEGQFPS